MSLEQVDGNGKDINLESLRFGKPVPFWEMTILLDANDRSGLSEAIIESAKILGDLADKGEVVNRRYSGYFLISEGTLRYSSTRMPVNKYGIPPNDECIFKRSVLEDQLRARRIPYEAMDVITDGLDQSFSQNEDFRSLVGFAPGYFTDSQSIDTEYAIQRTQVILGKNFQIIPAEIFSVGGTSVAGIVKPYTEDVMRISGKMTNWHNGLQPLYKLADMYKQERIILETPIVSFNVETQYCPPNRSDLVSQI